MGTQFEENASLSEITPLHAHSDNERDKATQREAEIQRKIIEIQKTIALETNQGESSWGELLLPCIYKPSLLIQKAMIVGCGIAFFQQATGIDAVVYYTPLVFKDLGLSDEEIFLYTFYMGLAKGGFIIVAMILLDRIGRKPLLLMSSVLMLICLIGLS